VKPVEGTEGANRVLIVTKEVEGSGLDMMEVERLARIVLG
jgi:hypothetical protein